MTFGIYVEWWPLTRGTKEVYAHCNDRTLHLGLTKSPAKWRNGRCWIVEFTRTTDEVLLDA